MESGLYNKALNIALKYKLPEELVHEAEAKAKGRK
jgi:hypothetical protein